MKNVNAGEPSQTWLGEASERTRCVQYDSGAVEAAQSTEPYQGDVRIFNSPRSNNVSKAKLSATALSDSEYVIASFSEAISFQDSEAKQSSSNNVTPYLIRGRLDDEGRQGTPAPLVGRAGEGTSTRLIKTNSRHPELTRIFSKNSVIASFSEAISFQDSEAKQSSFNNVTPYLIRGRLSGERRQNLKTAFSLIELMISLIVVSCITAAFTPVITKKLKSGSLIAGSVGDAFRNTKMGEDECEAQTGIKNCSWCDTKKKECKICKLSKVCKEDEFENTPDCSCHKCITKFEGCLFCTSKECSTCIAGKYSDNGTCKNVIDSPCGATCYTDPTATPPVVDPKPCPDGSICSNGIKTDCISTNPSDTNYTHKLCKEGIAKPCPDGSICELGKETKCNSTNPSAVNYTHKLCKDGISKTCTEGFTCDEGKATTCVGKPASTWCVNGIPTTCPEGNTCSNGIHTSCSSKPVSTWCINGIPTECPEGYTCSAGKRTPCTGVASTTRCLNGTTTTCTAGYYCVNGVQPNSQCKTGCTNCSGANTCETCQGTQYLLDGTCTGCPTNATCNGSTFTCKDGFWSTGSACNSCHANCKTCTGSGNTNCTSCNDTKWISGTTCNNCATHANCNGTTQTCHANWSGSSCSTYTPPCTWGWWVGSTKYSSSEGSWSWSGNNCSCVRKSNWNSSQAKTEIGWSYKSSSQDSDGIGGWQCYVYLTEYDAYHSCRMDWTCSWTWSGSKASWTCK